MITHKTFRVGPLGCNCTVVANTVEKTAVVIDPGGDAGLILELLEKLEVKVEKIIHTHAHFDHFLASAELRAKTGAKLHLHPDDLPLWVNLERQCAYFKIPFTPTPDPDVFLSDGQDVGISGAGGVALHTPGHTPGSMCFLYESTNLLIAGDTLFREGIGRTDLWGGDQKKILTSIRERLFTLPEETAVVPGHGEFTTIGHEKYANPYCS